MLIYLVLFCMYSYSTLIFFLTSVVPSVSLCTSCLTLYGRSSLPDFRMYRNLPYSFQVFIFPLYSPNWKSVGPAITIVVRSCQRGQSVSFTIAGIFPAVQDVIFLFFSVVT